MQKLTFEFSLEEVNQLLTILGQLPFVQSSTWIGNIQQQAIPQLKVEEEAKDSAAEDVVPDQ